MLIRSVIPLGLVVAGLVFGSCRHVPAGGAERTQRRGDPATQGASSEAEAPREERWVQSGAAAGGDGTRERPHGSIEEALASGAGRALHLRLLAGEYTGTWELPSGTVLEGDAGPWSPPPGFIPEEVMGNLPEARPAPRLQAPVDASAPLLRSQGAITVKGLTLVAGSQPLEGPGPWHLEEVRLESGSCLSMQRGRLSAEKVTFVATGEGGTCLDLTGEASAELDGVFFDGPWRVGLALAGSAEAKTRLFFSKGATWPIRQRGGVIYLELANLAGSGEAGFYVAGGRALLQYVVVEGFDYGVMAGKRAQVAGDGLRLGGAKRAGLAIVGAEVELSDVEVRGIRGEGAFAGVQMIGGVAELTDVRIHDVSAAGVSQRDGELTVDGLSIDGVQASADGSEGAGLSIRLGSATLRKPVIITRAGGPGVLVAESARLAAPGLSISKAGGPGVVVETGGGLEVEALRVEQSSSPALLVTEKSSAKISSLTIAPEGGRTGTVSARPNMIVANCEEGAQVQLGTLHLGTIEGGTVAAAPIPRSACLHELTGRESSGR
jgi:hypothetical protein